MTNQSALNKVYKWFVTERHGIAKTGDGNMCVYRGANGARCAIGCLIPDRKYRKGFEGLGIDELLCQRTVETLREHFLGVDKDLLVELQGLHDDYGYYKDDSSHEPDREARQPDEHFLKHMRDGLMDIAKEWNLNIPK